MDIDLDNLQRQAVTTLQNACGSRGIFPRPVSSNNNQNIRARDAMIAGIAGLLDGDQKVIQGFHNSIITLVKHQHNRGMIPSHIGPDESNPDISYGHKTGDVDVQTWYLIGTCLYLLNHADGTLIDKIQPRLEKVFNLLDYWEYNADGLIYTPTGSNWANEYPIQGYTLYDNLLRLWALKLYNNLFEDETRQQQQKQVEEKIALNYWPKTSDKGHPQIYHPRGFSQIAIENPDHFACAIDPCGYNLQFDAAGNGLALLLNMASIQQYKQILEYLKPTFRQISTVLVPAFWPVITSDDPKWFDLKNNFNGNFKNYPHGYQNGGIWPVWMGLFALGANVTGKSDLPQTILRAWMKIENTENIRFSEHFASNTLKTGGDDQLCHSAAGLIFLITAIRQDSLDKLHLG